MNKLSAIILILTATLSMTACVDTEKNKLDNRVLAYWKYKINREFDKAYEFLSPGWKSSESQESYISRMRQSRAKWLVARVAEKKCTKTDLCEVEVGIEYEYQFKGIGGGDIKLETSLKENWIMKGNIWYNVPLIKQNI